MLTRKKASKRKLTTPSSKKAVKQMTLAPLSSGKKNSVSSSPSVRDNTKIRLSMFSAEDEPACDVGSQQEKQWTHLSMDFLREDKIMDAQKRRPNDPEYDPKTLYLPEDLKGKLTPAHRQWWDIKSKNFDVVLFFKVGKFYELFHMDAVIGVKELNLLFMKGDYAHSGFPEISYAKYSQTLIQKGYKVARIEQTETPEMADARCKKMSRSSKFDKVVNRELCRITTRGTMTCGVLEGDIGDSRARYLLAIAEQKIGSQSSSLGVCFVDTTIGSFHLGQFEDDKHFSRLRTLMAHHSPVQILYEKGRISGSLKGVICMVPVERDGLAPESEFWNADKTLNFLSENAYFDEQEEDWPQELLNLSTGDKRTVRGDRELAIRALGAVIWYLNRCLIDQELVSLRQFHWYEPIQEFSQQSVSPNQTDSYMKSQRNMVLDEITLKNLEVVVNSSGTEEGTLLQQLDRCVTPFGKRLLRQWVCNPLCRPKGINSRLDAIEDILAHKDAIETVIGLLRQLPDLQRLLSRIHTQGHGKRSQDHPDSRAILFEAQIYSKRKITDFISALNGFKVAAEIQDLMHKLVGDSQSELLKQILTLERDGGRFPDLIPQLQFFEGAFDKKQALKDGCITPANGVDREYDMALRNLQEVESQFQGYLKEQSQFFGCKVLFPSCLHLECYQK
ncbi:unnamed protein product [Darwinula stevensoni]|uniref:DNA mismatch repair protein MutS core domain-containing protein n=1 Tax=Darwinula stevensoni TaxID=69355 RepID=A0A7R9A4R6_9CRUS|nr:unnamed protein product [Darwinula stevensoni]CAG0893054.1 unnamed protein product [Darwinula stevensoni]